MKQLIKKLISAEAIHAIKVRVYRIFGGNSIKVASGNNLILGDNLLKGCNIRILGHGNRVMIGGGNTLTNCNIQIYGSNCEITIGFDNLFVDSIFWLEDNNSKIIIGNNNKMCGKVRMGIVEGTTLQIENNCLFSSDIYITTTDSHSILDKASGRRINPSQNVLIRNHVWIGHSATILKGVEIADNVVIGSSALVAKSIEESNVVVAGNPARIIKHNIDWNIQRI